MPTAPPGMSITEAQRVLQMQDRELAAFPEVRACVRQDRPRRFVHRSRAALDGRDGRHAEARIGMAPGRDLRVAGAGDGRRSSATPACRTPGGCRSRRATRCSRRACAASSASRSSAPTSPTIERAALAVEGAIHDVPGTRSAFAERLTGGFYLDIEVDRDAIARHGLRVRDVSEVIESALGGMNVAQTVEGRERYPIAVRYARDYREDLDALEAHARDDAQPAHKSRSTRSPRSSFAMGPDMVRSESGTALGLRVRGRRGPPDRRLRARRAARRRGAGAASARRATRVGRAVPGLERARDRLNVVVPLTLLLGLAAALLQHAAPASRRRSSCWPCRSRWSAPCGCSFAARLQPVDRGVGRHHRARGARRRDGRRDAALPDARAPRACRVATDARTWTTSRNRSSKAPRAASGRRR